MIVFLIVILLFTLMLGGFALALSKSETNKRIGKILISVISTLVIGAIALFLLLFVRLSNKSDIYACSCMAVVATIEFVILATIWRWWRVQAVRVAAVFLTVASIGAMTGSIAGDYREKHILKVREDTSYIFDYKINKNDSKVVSLDAAPTLTITEDVPRITSATALFPIVAGTVKAIYPSYTYDDDVYMSFGGSDNVYNEIIEGEYDMAIAAYPSEEQLELAAENNINLKLTPIGREAFVFFVNSENSVDNLTTEQLKGIYSGKITNWKDVGGKNKKIKAFQRNQNSGSQSALIRFMDGTSLMKAPTEDVIDAMTGIIDRVADYRNYKNAIGFSVNLSP